MKQIYWIDDNIEQMMYIIQGAIKKLWKIGQRDVDGIASNIIIFGNDRDDSDTDDILSQKNENDIKIRLHDMSRLLCDSQDGPNLEQPVYNSRKELVKDKVNILYKEENPEDKNQYQNLKRAWITNEFTDSENEKYKEATEEAHKLIERMKIDSESVIGIDILLFYGDYERLRDKKRIISMELYDILKKRGFSCFMYSSEADDNELMQNWCEICESFYQQRDIKIYQRSDFMQKSRRDISAEIEAMFES